MVVKKPTSKSTWKLFERVVASFFGTKRVPLSGSNSGHGTNSDSLHPKLYIECKVRSKIALWQLFVDTENKAKVEHKVPVVAVKQKGEKMKQSIFIHSSKPWDAMDSELSHSYNLIS